MTKTRLLTLLAPGLLALTIAPLDAGDIVGRVRYAGEAPAPAKIKITKDKKVCGKKVQFNESLVVSCDRGIRSVVVSLSDVNDGKKMPAPTQNVQLDQNGCKFVPRVQIVPAGAPLDILNSDGILHNIHTHPKANTPVNKAQPKFRKKMPVTFAKPDLIRIACDVHSWMKGWVVVAGHPYYSLSDDAGSFKIAGVPAGTFTIEYWHEKLGKQTGKVTVPATGSVTADFEFAAK